jgi:hypothetical protein
MIPDLMLWNPRRSHEENVGGVKPWEAMEMESIEVEWTLDPTGQVAVAQSEGWYLSTLLFGTQWVVTAMRGPERWSCVELSSLSEAQRAVETYIKERQELLRLRDQNARFREAFGIIQDKYPLLLLLFGDLRKIDLWLKALSIQRADGM